MGRNIVRDEREQARRRAQLIQAGFELFSANGIEAVSLNAVAERADVGIATMYKYFQNKLNLVVAISTQIWGDVWRNSLSSISKENFMKMNAYELAEVYCDTIIEIYHKRPEILRFSASYKTFVNREGASKEQYIDHIAVLQPIEELFSLKYEEAKKDKSIRTDISSQDMFSMIALTMLAMAERYAQGIVWAKKQDDNNEKALIYTKEMILNWLKNKE